MTPTQARSIAASLIEAADKAEAEGTEHVDLLTDLRAADDAARGELEAAIKAAATFQIDN
jgi:hypothetical protein